MPQPNAAPYDYQDRSRYCNHGGFPCFPNASASPPPIAFSLPASAVTGLESVALLADLHDAPPDAARPSFVATLNGVALPRFPEHDAVLASGDGLFGDWVRRAVPVPNSALAVGANSLALALEPGIYVDRLELELGYGAAGVDRLFADGYESSGAIASTKRQGVDRLERGVTSPLFPLTGRSPLHQCAH